MADQGSGGAFEISQRMTAMVGWGATSGFQEVRGVGTVQQAARAGCQWSEAERQAPRRTCS